MLIQEAIRKLSEKTFTPGKGKATIKDVEFMDFGDAVDDLKSMKIKVTRQRDSHNRGTKADLTGQKKALFLYLTGADYGMPDDDAAAEYPELMK